MPLHITSFQRFNVNSAMNACHCYLPEQVINSTGDLLGAVCGALGINPDVLRTLVRDKVLEPDCEIQTAVENWLICYGITKKQYLNFIINRHKPIDGLFVWLVVHATKSHLNILHASGVWTSCHSNITVLTDASSIVLVVNCTLHIGKMTREAIKKHNDKFVEMLCDPRPTLADFASLPRILNNPVKDIPDRMEEIGLKEKQADAPIQNYLAFLLECDMAAYRL